jgi:hypothetical protein
MFGLITYVVSVWNDCKMTLIKLLQFFVLGEKEGPQSLNCISLDQYMAKPLLTFDEYTATAHGIEDSQYETKKKSLDEILEDSSETIVLYCVWRPGCALNRHFARILSNHVKEMEEPKPKLVAILRNTG